MKKHIGLSILVGFVTFVAFSQEKDSLPSFPLSAYTGMYKHEVYGSMNITISGKNLLMKFQHHPILQVSWNL